MKEGKYSELKAVGRAIRLMLAGVLTLGVVASALANSTKIIFMGDMRGDNKAKNVKYVQDPNYPNDPTKLIGIGFKDQGITLPAFRDMAVAISNEGPAVVLVVGDLVSKWIPQINGKDADTLMAEQFALWAETWRNYAGQVPVFPVRGNQEWCLTKRSTWFDFIKSLPGIGSLNLNGPTGEEGLTFSFQYKDVLFVAIDQYVAAPSADSPVITPAALAWLQAQFAASDRPHVFVYGHAPAYEVYDSKAVPPLTAIKDGLPSPAPVDASGNPGNPVMSCEAVMNVRNPFWSILGSEGAGAYFCGHDHIYARGVAQDVNGIPVRQVIIGNGGAPGTTPWDPIAYNMDPFIESATRNSPFCCPIDTTMQLCSPLIQVEYFDQPQLATEPTKTGYVVLEIQGSKVTATYKAQTARGAAFEPLDTWSWKIEDNQDEQ